MSIPKLFRSRPSDGVTIFPIVSVPFSWSKRIARNGCPSNSVKAFSGSFQTCGGAGGPAPSTLRRSSTFPFLSRTS